MFLCIESVNTTSVALVDLNICYGSVIYISTVASFFECMFRTVFIWFCVKHFFRYLCKHQFAAFFGHAMVTNAVGGTACSGSLLACTGIRHGVYLLILMKSKVWEIIISS